MEENIPAQLVKEPTRGGALLNLLTVNKKGQVGDVGVSGFLGHSDQEM